MNLDAAIKRGDLEAVRCLPFYGVTALNVLVSVWEGHLEIFRILIDRYWGPDVLRPSLIMAITAGHLDLFVLGSGFRFFSA